jgi:molybdopterin-guanine dinucleotide biosynthesis protein A
MMSRIRRHAGVYAGVLIGGASTRMGQSKSLLRWEGESFLERVLTAVRDRVERVVLLGDGPLPTAMNNYRRLPDVPGLAGPLAGMLAAMRWEPAVCWVFAACDLPRLRSEAIDWLLGERCPDHWVVLPRVDPKRVEPLLAVYEPQAVELLEELVARGCHSPRQLEYERRVHMPTPPIELHDCWTNVNTPDEFRQLEARTTLPPKRNES